MKLYLIHTKGLGGYYVIAKSFDEASNELRRLLDKAEYGFSGDRDIREIKVIANELTYFPPNKPNFTDKGGDLIIIK